MLGAARFERRHAGEKRRKVWMEKICVFGPACNLLSVVLSHVFDGEFLVSRLMYGVYLTSRVVLSYRLRYSCCQLRLLLWYQCLSRGRP